MQEATAQVRSLFLQAQAKALSRLVDRYLAGEEPTIVLAAVEAMGPQMASLFGYALACRLHKNGGDRDRIDNEADLLCSRAGVNFAAFAMESGI